MFLRGAQLTAQGHAAVSPSPVYNYHFTYDGALAFTKQIGLPSKKGKFLYWKCSGFTTAAAFSA
jgi:hypothetical protein